MSEQTEEEYLIERLSKLLAEISVIVNGPQPIGVLWSYADLPEKVQALKDATPPRPQASAEDVALVQRVIKRHVEWHAPVEVAQAWQRIEADMQRLLGVGRE